jgi:hypothetical protein
MHYSDSVMAQTAILLSTIHQLTSTPMPKNSFSEYSTVTLVTRCPLKPNFVQLNLHCQPLLLALLIVLLGV